VSVSLLDDVGAQASVCGEVHGWARPVMHGPAYSS
jgi:hypothetical protein